MSRASLPVRRHVRTRIGVASAIIMVLAGSGLAAGSAMARSDAAAPPARATDGLVALYAFDENSGTTVHDVSGVGVPVNLSIGTPSSTVWGPQGLDVVRPTLISSSGPATKINDAIRGTEGLTVEAWVTPQTSRQGGPARIAALSGGTAGVNVALDQGAANGAVTGAFTSRMRSTVTSDQGATITAARTASTTLTHVVYTRSPYGMQRLYVNGVLMKQAVLNGGLSNWNSAYRLVLAGDLMTGRSWLGGYQLVAVYKRALSQSEVANNFAAGPGSPTTDPTSPPTSSGPPTTTTSAPPSTSTVPPTTSATSPPPTTSTAPPTTSTTSPPPTTSTAPPQSHKWLIKYGQDIPTPEQFAANRALYESRPFDGWVIDLPTYSAGVLSSVAYSQAAFAAELARFPSGLTRSTHNWVRLIVVNPLDFASDSQWATISANVRNLSAAMAASNRQFDGIFIDNEWYGSGSGPWNYGTSTTPWSGSPNSSAATASRNQARARGNQFMSALSAGWPSAKVMLAYGPWVGESMTSNAISSLSYNDVAWANELMGTFAYGLSESTEHSQARVVDGGEVYGARTASNFSTLRSWQRTGFADSGSVIIPPGESDAYKSVTTASVGVYDLDALNGYSILPAPELGSLVSMALKSVDQYAWLYTEQYEWGASQSGKPNVPQSFLDAISNADAQGG
jgi:cell division septation protein DedD